MQTRMCWTEFWWHLTGLLADPDTRLARQFTPHDDGEVSDGG